MKKGIRQIRKCKWCGKQVKEGYTKHRFKQYYKTCGSKNCLTASFRDAGVNISKRFSEMRTCQKCKKDYEATSPKQRWCKECSPDRKSSTILQRYDISRPQWDAMFKNQKGTCKLCPRPARIVDHNHKTNKIRGLLCHKCNILVGILEKSTDGMTEWIKKALIYIK